MVGVGRAGEGAGAGGTVVRVDGCGHDGRRGRVGDGAVPRVGTGKCQRLEAAAAAAVFGRLFRFSR